MAAIARVLGRAFLADDQLATIAIFSGFGLLMSVFFISFSGTDLINELF
jgi:hypothetical protein